MEQCREPFRVPSSGSAVEKEMTKVTEVIVRYAT